MLTNCSFRRMVMYDYVFYLSTESGSVSTLCQINVKKCDKIIFDSISLVKSSYIIRGAKWDTRSTVPNKVGGEFQGVPGRITPHLQARRAGQKNY